jgi:hypothetical protein
VVCAGLAALSSILASVRLRADEGNWRIQEETEALLSKKAAS